MTQLKSNWTFFKKMKEYSGFGWDSEKNEVKKRVVLNMKTAIARKFSFHDFQKTGSDLFFENHVLL